jgi:2-hydroxychromene-2-carboxylate isomerase
MPSAENIAAALSSAGQDLARIHALAASAEVKEGFKQQATRALERGIFGSPSFVVGNELFWGDDRLDEAIALATSVH